MANVALLEKSHLTPSEPQFVQIRLREPRSVAVGERFVVRASVPRLAGGRVTTVGGGRVLGASGIRLRRKRPWTIQALSDRRAAIDDTSAWVAQCLREATAPMSAEALGKAAQRPAANVAAVLAELLAAGKAVELVPGQFAHSEAVERSAAAIVEAVEAFHQANPVRMGAEQAALADQAGRAGPGRCSTPPLQGAFPMGDCGGTGRSSARRTKPAASAPKTGSSSSESRLCSAKHTSNRPCRKKSPSRSASRQNGSTR